MIRIEHPRGYEAERQYIFHVLFSEFLGLDWSSQATDRDDVRISSDGTREIAIPDVLFSSDREDWLTESTLPVLPLAVDENFEELPIIYGHLLENESVLSEAADRIEIGIDIFGSSFFMLTRYEELINQARDVHTRFAGRSSIAHKHEFLERPIVNEYVDILWSALAKLWPDLKRKERQYQVFLTHDVDHPAWVAGKPWKVVIRNAAGDMMRRGNVKMGVARLKSRLKTGFDKTDKDPANLFEWIMDLSEEHSTKSAFYFIAERTAGEIDGYYSLDLPWIRGLLKRIDGRGHEIGIHPSYRTYKSNTQISKELKILERACQSEGISQNIRGGRHHYLRWEAPVTWQAWENAGLAYDTTVGYADKIGFRCGTCYDFPVFNLQTKEMLNLRERPLIVMDGTLFDYMRLSDEEALERTIALADQCKKHQGEFVLLWHNTELIFPQQQELYKAILGGIY